MTSFRPASDPSKENRLNAIIAECLRRKDAGQPVDHEQLLLAYPDLKDELQSWFKGEALLAGQNQPVKRSPRESRPTDMRDTSHPRTDEFDTASEFNARRFGRYRLLRLLGEGAMGSVYLANDTTLDRQVALKTPKTEGSRDAEFMLRFMREAKAAAALRHENICSVFDAGEHEGVAYITMDYIDGVPLSRFVASSKLSSLDSILTMIHTIADAVGHAHHNGVVHRDLKPGNIIVDSEMKPFVTDFGLARRINTDDESRITQEGLLIGTPAYMAPEQIKGQQAKVGPRSDIYSLGVIFFELLTARLPFEGPVVELLTKSLRDDPPVPSRIRQGLPEDVDDICLKMLKKDPNERYASMEDVKAALKQLQQKLSVQDAEAAGGSSALEKYKAHIGVMLKHGQYAEAMQHLREMTTDTRPESKPLVEWARKKLPAVRKESAALSPSGLKALLDTANALFRNHDYRGCIQLLEDVPEIRRTNEIEDLLRRAEQLEIKAEQLLLEIKTLERQETVAGLESTIKKFLKLKPGNKYAKQLLEALQTYSRLPPAQRRYHFQNGRLQPMPRGSMFWQWVLTAAAVGLLVFGCVYSYTIFYLNSGQQTLAVHVDDEWLESQGGVLTLSVDGNDYTLSSNPQASQPISVSVSFGEHSFSVSQGDTVVHAPKTFEITKDDRRVLYISPVDIELLYQPKQDQLSAADQPQFNGTRNGQSAIVERVWQPESVSNSSNLSELPEQSSGLELDEAENRRLNNKLTHVTQVHGATIDQLNRWANNLPKTFRPYWISIRSAGEEILFDALARHAATQVDWKLASITANTGEFEQVTDGYSPAIVNSWMQDGVMKQHLMVLRDNPGGQFWSGGTEEISKHIENGFSDITTDAGEVRHVIPTHLSSVRLSSGMYNHLCMAYGPYSVGEFVTDLPMGSIGSLLLGYHRRGWRLHLLAGIRDSAEPRYNAIFVPNQGPDGPFRKWAVSPRLTIAQYQETLLKIDAMGGWPRCVTSTIEDGRVIYRVLWDGITQEKRKTIPIFSDPDSPTERAHL